MVVCSLKMAKIQNVVITATLSKKFDLKKLSEKFKDSKFNPSRFPALRLKFGKVAFLLFNSGKLVCTGSKSVEQGRQVTEELLQNLAHFGYRGIQMEAFIVQNIVASGNLGYKIRLDWLHSAHMKNCLWDQESFPGLRYRFEEFGLSVICFLSGKYFLTGAKKTEDIQTASCIFESIAKRYKCVHQ